VLVELKRYDLLLKYYQDHGLVLQEEMIQQLRAYLFTNHFDIAQEKAHQLLALNPPLSAQDKLRVAQCLLISGEQEAAAKVVKTIAAEANPSLETVQELMRSYQLSGDYVAAQELAKRSQEQLMQSPQGILLLAQLKARLSQNDEALVLANQAYQLASKDPSILRFILRNESSVESLALWVAKLRKQLEANVADTALQTAYADAVNQLIIEAHHQEKPIDQYVSDLNQAKYLLDSLVERYPEVPLLQFMAGEYALLAGKLQSALDQVNKALTLDVSYVDSYLYKGIVLEGLGQPLAAVEAVKQAVKFSPDDAEAWQELYDLYNNHGIFLDAIGALQNAIKYRPNEPKGYMQLAALFLSLNNPEQARETLKLALKHSPDNVDLMKLLLRTLNDPNLAQAVFNSDDLKLEQQLLNKRLAEIDPETP
jgi:tetratricopeptide (TPR) repeat protein